MLPAAGLLDYLTLAITWPQIVFSHGGGHTAAAQVNGDVRSGHDPKHQKRLAYPDIRNYLAKND
jgi:uncharacterized protein (DUF1786 family)